MFATYLLNGQFRTEIASHSSIADALGAIVADCVKNGWKVVSFEPDGDRAADVATSKGCMMNLYAIERI